MMTRNLIVNRGVKVAVLTLAGLGAGCVGLNIAGFPLGPQQEGGMEITGAIAPQVAANSCVFNPGGPSIVEPIVELGTQGTRANRYRAVFGVFNTRDSNESNQQRAANGPHQGTYGSEDSSAITVIGANVRYEYPTLPPASRLTAQQIPPADGFLFQSKTTASGEVFGQALTAVPVDVINAELGAALFDNEDFRAAMTQDGSVPIVARVRLEGRTGAGFRAISNEYALVITAVPTGTIRNCTRDAANPTTFTCVRNTTLVGTQLPQCFQDQDIPLCGGCPTQGE